MEYCRAQARHHRIAMGYTPFSQCYGYKAMLLVELNPPSHRRLTYDQMENQKLLLESLNSIEEQRDKAQLQVIIYQ